MSDLSLMCAKRFAQSRAYGSETILSSFAQALDLLYDPAALTHNDDGPS
jgi:hypothetical protein